MARRPRLLAQEVPAFPAFPGQEDKVHPAQSLFEPGRAELGSREGSWERGRMGSRDVCETERGPSGLAKFLWSWFQDLRQSEPAADVLASRRRGSVAGGMG